MTRNILDKRLKSLISELAEMGSLVEKQIYDSINALKNHDVELSEKVIKNDDKVDALNKRIEEKCLIYMATQSPMASDLRKMFAASKIVTDLERIADYAVDICKINKRIEIDPLGEAEIPLWNMVEILSKMINMSVEAFVNSDVEEAYRICKLDDEVDVIYRKLFNDVIKKMGKDENLINKGTQILFASKYLERMGDHITNICEWIIFSKEGNNKRRGSPLLLLFILIFNIKI